MDQLLQFQAQVLETLFSAYTTSRTGPSGPSNIVTEGGSPIQTEGGSNITTET